MNTTRLKWLLAASLALNAGVIGTVVADRFAAQPQAPLAQSAPVNLPDYLELTPEQRQRWNDIEQGFLKDIATNWKDIRTHRERLVRQVFQRRRIGRRSTRSRRKSRRCRMRSSAG